MYRGEIYGSSEYDEPLPQSHSGNHAFDAIWNANVIAFSLLQGERVTVEIERHTRFMRYDTPEAVTVYIRDADAAPDAYERERYHITSTEGVESSMYTLPNQVVTMPLSGIVEARRRGIDERDYKLKASRAVWRFLKPFINWKK